MKHAIYVILTLSAGAAVCVAGVEVEAEQHRLEIVNDTGQVANDFHIQFEIGGMDLPWIEPGGYESDSYTDMLMHALAGWCMQWSGGTTNPGESASFNWGIRGDKDVRIKEYYWTFDGEKIVPTEPQRRGVLQKVDLKVLMDDRNISGEIRIPLGEDAMFVKRRTYSTGDVLTATDLARGGAVWQAAAVIDATPVLIAAGTELIATLPYVPEYRGYAFLYDVYPNVGGSPGARVGTQAMSMDVVPEPATLSLLALGACLPLLRRSKTCLPPAGRQVRRGGRRR